MTSARARGPVVSMEGEQEEQHAEHILALRGPDYRLDVNRVQGKQSTHRQTGPGESRGPLQQQEQQHRISRVEQEICVVVANRIEVKDLAVQGMRQPGPGGPVPQNNIPPLLLTILTRCCIDYDGSESLAATPK